MLNAILITDVTDVQNSTDSVGRREGGHAADGVQGLRISSHITNDNPVDRISTRCRAGLKVIHIGETDGV